MSNLYHTPLAEAVIGCAINVHRTLGPGLLESTYLVSLTYELSDHGIEFQTQVALPVIYKGRQLDCGYRIDLQIGSDLILEAKSVEKFQPVHTAQVLTCLKLSGCRQALLINFNVEILKNGIKSFLRPKW